MPSERGGRPPKSEGYLPDYPQPMPRALTANEQAALWGGRSYGMPQGLPARTVEARRVPQSGGRAPFSQTGWRKAAP